MPKEPSTFSALKRRLDRREAKRTIVDEIHEKSKKYAANAAESARIAATPTHYTYFYDREGNPIRITALGIVRSPKPVPFLGNLPAGLNVGQNIEVNHLLYKIIGINHHLGLVPLQPTWTHIRLNYLELPRPNNTVVPDHNDDVLNKHHGKRRTIGIDFDGTIHEYKTPFTVAEEIPDNAIPGAMEFIRHVVLDRDENVSIFTARIPAIDPKDPSVIRAKRAIIEWTHAQLTKEFGEDIADKVITRVSATRTKPFAYAYLDDRALHFDGKHFPTDEQLDKIEDQQPAAGK